MDGMYMKAIALGQEIDELRASIQVYRDALKIAAQRFRTMRHETAAQDIERILETT